MAVFAFNGVNVRLAINGSASLQTPYKTVAIKFMWDGKAPVLIYIFMMMDGLLTVV